MGGEGLALEPAGGIDEPGVLGTDPVRIQAAIERAMSGDGVLVLMDLGSALMSTEFAIEMLPEGSAEVLMSDGPLVEGAVAAAVAARGGATLAEVAAEARRALAMKSAQLGAPQPGSDLDGPRGEELAPADAEATLVVRNEIGLHARPAARLVETVRRFDAEVRIATAQSAEPVRATSLTNVVGLGARFGDTLSVSAVGPEAREAIEALQALAEEGFGDGVASAAGNRAFPRDRAADGRTTARSHRRAARRRRCAVRRRRICGGGDRTHAAVTRGRRTPAGSHARGSGSRARTAPAGHRVSARGARAGSRDTR